MSDDKKALEDALERYADHMRISACADNEGQHNAHMDAAHGEYLTILHMFDALRAAQQAKVPDDVVLLPAEATDEMQDNMRQALIDQGWDSDSAGEVDFADLWHAGVYEYQERTADMLAAKALSAKHVNDTYMRPAVARFARRMEDVLRKNDHKGGWENTDIACLYIRLLEEARELETAIRYGGNRNTKDDAAVLVANEAADVANFAMMIADNAMLAAKAKGE